MHLAGIGTVFSRGRGIAALEEALRGGWVAPARKELHTTSGESMPVYSVDAEATTDRRVLKRMRRADRFGKMAVLAAWDAVQDGDLALNDGDDGLGIILATAFGPHVTAFGFLDEVVEYGDAGPSPTLFSHSVHNAAASYIASALGSRGPTLTLTQFAFSFHQALVLADAWIREGRCDRVLVGSAEECGAVMEYACNEKLVIARDGRIRPFAFDASPVAVLGEGSAFFLLTREETPKHYCELGGVRFDEEPSSEAPDLYLLDADGMCGDERGYRKVAERGVEIASYTPLFGSMMTGSAFHCACAALILSKQMRYGCPVADHPHGIEPCTTTGPSELGALRCVRYCGSRDHATIELRR